MELDPETLPPAEAYGLMIATILPRPIAWVSTADAAGRANLAPFSFFTGITARPMTVCFAPVNDRAGKKKDTLLNIEETRQFVVNVVTEELAARMNQTSAGYPRGVSEFEQAGLTPAPSSRVRPPYVRESPVQLECELMRIVRVGEGPLGGNLVIGKVLLVRAAESVWKENRISHKDMKPIGRMGGTWYAKVTDDFELPRPRP